MNGEDSSGKSRETEAPEVEEIARRYLDLWQDQMTALAADPEFAAAWRKLVESLGAQTAAWQAHGLPVAGGLPDPMAAMQAMMAGVRPGTEGKAPGGATEGRGDEGSEENSGRTGGKAAQRAAASAAASGRGGDDLEQLAARLDELERRLAALEAGSADQGGGAGKRDRKSRS